MGRPKDILWAVGWAWAGKFLWAGTAHGPTFRKGKFLWAGTAHGLIFSVFSEPGRPMGRLFVTLRDGPWAGP